MTEPAFVDPLLASIILDAVSPFATVSKPPLTTRAVSPTTTASRDSLILDSAADKKTHKIGVQQSGTRGLTLTASPQQRNQQKRARGLGSYSNSEVESTHTHTHTVCVIDQLT